MKLLAFLIFSCSLTLSSQNVNVQTFNSNFFSVFGVGQTKKTLSNGKDLVTWNIQSSTFDKPVIALMDSAMNIKWCFQYNVGNFAYSYLEIETIKFDEDDNLIVCGNGTLSALPSGFIMRINRNNGDILWHSAFYSTNLTTAYARQSTIFFFGNKYGQNEIATYMCAVDTSQMGSNAWINFKYQDSVNGSYRIVDAMQLKNNRHLVYLSPLNENKGNNQCKVICLDDNMIVKWKRGYKELSHSLMNNSTLVHLNDSEYVVNNVARDSSIFKFNKRGELIWGKKLTFGGEATIQSITGNLLLVSRTENEEVNVF